MTRSIWAAFLSTISLATITASSARAGDGKDGKKVCTDAYSQAQTLRDAHRLNEARDQLRICSQSTCTEFIVKDCTAWLLETEARVPSIVLSAKDSRGQPLIDVSVSMDGKTIAQKLDGQSIDVDPGLHTFMYVARDGTKVEQPFAVLEGQKAQSVAVILPTAVPSSAPPPGGVPITGAAPVARAALSANQGSVNQAESDGPSFWTTQRTIGVASAGLGVAGVVVGTIFGLTAISSKNRQNSDCGTPSSCTDQGHALALTDHSNATADGTVSTATFIAGGALLAVGAILFFTGGHKLEQPAASTGLLVTPTFGPLAGGMALRGAF